MNEPDSNLRRRTITKLSKRRDWLVRLMLAVLGGLAVLAATGANAASSVRHNGSIYTNRLIHSHDPYLLMHAHNPVDWYPWGAAAFAAAKRENKPIFLTVGFSTCYWCHVADRQLYSNPKIAKLMNHWFINVVVDREQRPDVDRVYMLATQIMTGSGGWPNDVFLTPNLKPFFAGSYFPPKNEYGQTGFPTILASLHKAWTQHRAHVLHVAARVYQAMQQVEQRPAASRAALQPTKWLQLATQQAEEEYNAQDSGFPNGGGIMFPQTPMLAMLLTSFERYHDQHALAMVSATLTAMAEGGLMDQLAGGFHRYSTDPKWDIPHFEKMLYDNAQLLGLYARAYAITKRSLFKQVALRTAHFLRTEMAAPGGGFYTALASEINGVEGADYVWTRHQIDSVLGLAGARRFFKLYELIPMPQSFGGLRPTPGGVLRIKRQAAARLAARHHLALQIAALAPLRAKLLAVRDRRPQPAIDKQIITSDKALAILGFLQAGQALGYPILTRTAVATARWEWRHAFDPKTDALYHETFHGYANTPGFLADYALLGQAFLALHRATGSPVWLERARQIADAMIKHFAQPGGQLTDTTDAAKLLVTPPAEGDSVQPSGHSAAVTLLLGLAADGGGARYATAARRAIEPLAAQIDNQPSSWGAMVAAVSEPSFSAMLQSSGPAASAVDGESTSADHVQASAHWIAPGVLQVDIDIGAGYHINANPASFPYLVPTQLLIKGQPILEVAYPRAQHLKLPFAPKGLAVYTGQIQLRTTLPPSHTAVSKIELRVQVCNDQYCLAPGTIDIKVAHTP